MKKDEIIIFTDGSSRGNPGPGGWGVIVSFGGHISELGGREENTTNNRMELTGALQALLHLRNLKIKDQRITINTDSSYLINGVTKWAKNWQKNNWITTQKKPVLNKDIWQKLLFVVEGLEISWNLVKGHAGVKGNERVDEIATAFADGKRFPLYNGSVADYPISIFNTSEHKVTRTVSAEKKQHSRAKAYSYVSLVGGKIMIDKSWAECEARVKGVPGAKFKKALNPADERRIIASWAN